MFGTETIQLVYSDAQIADLSIEMIEYNVFSLEKI